MKQLMKQFAVISLLILVTFFSSACTKEEYRTYEKNNSTFDSNTVINNNNPNLKTISNNAKQNQDNKESSNTNNSITIKPSKFPYPDAVRGIYVTAYTTTTNRFKELIELLDRTELNAMVIDLKDDHGFITIRTDDPTLKPYSKQIIADPQKLIATLHEHNIYPIARIVVFKDSVYGAKHPEHSFLENGRLWRNKNGDVFTNPFLKDVWEYNLKVAKVAVELGFSEIQFDYVRFPEGFELLDKKLQYSLGDYQKRVPEKWETALNVYKIDEEKNKKRILNLTSRLERLEKFDNYLELREMLTENLSFRITTAKEDIKEELRILENNKPKPPKMDEKERLIQLRVDAVTDFVKYAREELNSLGVKVSVDIFGYSATLPEAPGIGQNFSRISGNVDVISSMIYPSHWSNGYFGISKPDLYPYELVKEYVAVENEVLSKLGDKRPISRPWLQDFTAPWLGKGNYMKYGAKEVELQIRALKEAGIKEFLLWNPFNKYSEANYNQ